MNKLNKSVSIVLVATIFMLITSVHAAISPVSFVSDSLIFDKETLLAQAKQGTATPLLQKKTTLSKAEFKNLKKEFEKLVKSRDAKKLSQKELRLATDLTMQMGWFDKALLYLQQMLTNSKDSEEIKTLKLQVADLLFEQGLLKKAGDAFGEYLELYPGAQESEYAHYKNVLCLFYQTLKTDQDQGPTRDAIKLTEAYLEKGIAYQKYRNEVRQIRQHCQVMLYENEVNVFNFYMKKKSYGAASGRLAYVKKQYQSKLPQLEPNIIQLECRLAEAQGNKELYNERLAFLNKKFPEHGKGIRVAQRSKKKAYVDRF